MPIIESIGSSSARAFGLTSGAAFVVRTNLVTYLDASISSSYPGTGTTWYDISGNGNNAGIYNGVSYSSGSGGYLQTDGGSGYIQLASNSSAAPYANQSFTIDMWIKRYSETGGYEILWDQSYTSHTDPYYSVHIRIDNPGAIAMMGGPNAVPGGSASAFTGNVWQHWVFSRDVTSGNNNCYRNGVLINNNVVSGTTSYYNNPLWIGKSNFDTSSTLQFGSVRYYNRQLTSQEVTQNFNATRTRFGV